MLICQKLKKKQASLSKKDGNSLRFFSSFAHMHLLVHRKPSNTANAYTENLGSSTSLKMSGILHSIWVMIILHSEWRIPLKLSGKFHSIWVEFSTPKIPLKLSGIFHSIWGIKSILPNFTHFEWDIPLCSTFSLTLKCEWNSLILSDLGNLKNLTQLNYFYYDTE